MNDESIEHRTLMCYQEFMQTNNYDIIGKKLLDELLFFTQSEYGLISDNKDNFLRVWIISDKAFTPEMTKIYKKNKAQLHFNTNESNNLFEKVVKEKKVIIDNNPPQNKIPHGHPPLHSFLGIPLSFNNKLIGVIGLANNPEGYNIDIINKIKSILTACTTIIYGNYFNKKNIELQKKIYKEKEINKTQNTFLAIMSHEIRTPLNGIIGMTNILKETSLNIEQQEYLEIINSCGIQLIYLIENILDFSKLRANKLTLYKEKFNLRECIEKSYDIILNLLQQKKIELQFFIDDNVPEYFIGDERRLKQILINLLSNASKFTNKGHIFTYVSIKEQNINSYKLCFKVEDTGIGIDKHNIKYIFKKFNQLNNSYTRHEGGTGLGLAITKSLVRLMSGNIKVDSEKNKGTIFTFTIIVDIDNSIKSIPKYNLTFKEKHNIINVLIIDDNENNRKILFKYLVSFGIKPMMCSCADEALMLLDSAYTFNILFIDIQMPIMNGIELAKTIKFKYSNKMQLVSMSSIGDINEDKKYFDFNLTKPIKKHKLQIYLEQFNLNKNDINNTYSSNNIYIKNNNENILIIEDNTMNQKVITKILNQMHYNNITLANNGKNALDILDKNNNFDIIFLDIIMPVMDGYTTAKKIKKLYPHLLDKIIVLTALATDIDINHFKKIGINKYLTKPIDNSALKQLLH